jgi:hypothetical protein
LHSRIEKNMPFFSRCLGRVALDPGAGEGRPPGHDLERAVGPVHPRVLAGGITALVDGLLHGDRIRVDGEVHRRLELARVRHSTALRLADLVDEAH